MRHELEKVKDKGCFSLPFLRINVRYLPKTCGTLDLLTCFVEVRLLEPAFETGQRAGDILTHELYQHLLAVLDGREVAEPVEVIEGKIADFDSVHEFVGATGVTRGTPLRGQDRATQHNAMDVTNDHRVASGDFIKGWHGVGPR